MKIYWRPLFYNVFIRPYHLIKYRNSKWKEFYCTKQCWNSKQSKQLMKEMDEAIKRLLGK